jgi:hypothetical protein
MIGPGEVSLIKMAKSNITGAASTSATEAIRMFIARLAR